MSLHKIHVLFIILLLWLGNFTLAAAEGGTIFFTALVEQGRLGTPQLVLEWGALDGKIPAEIDIFKLYRSVDGGDHEWLADISHSLITENSISSMVNSDISSRSTSLIENMNKMSLSEGGEIITHLTVSAFLQGLLNPASSTYNSLKVMLLSRAHLSAARAQGLAFIDDTIIASSTYHYILTAVTTAGESKPIGQSAAIDAGQETILPAPTGLTQVQLSSCLALAGGLDDNKINFRWDVPAGPQDMGLKVVTYGYELFWSESDLGAVDFRLGVPGGLYRVNQEPVVVAGVPPEEGPDSFLAKDGSENHDNGEGPDWKRGQSYFYYLTTRDIAGHYSAPVTAVELTVMDAQPPRAVWNAQVSEVKDPVDNITPRLALTWDAPTSLNFSRYYGSNRNICSATTEEVCWVGPEQSCNTDPVRCADLAVDHYRIFRFDSPRQASEWGIDSDGDGWPDNKENDSCDSDLHPAGVQPPEWIATISPDDSQFFRNLTDTHKQIIYVDKQEAGIPELNKVYWYKILAVDIHGNQSPLSPPLQGVLYDRSQPLPAATLSRLNCTPSVTLPGDCGTLEPETGDVFIVRDTTGKADSYQLQQFCGTNGAVIFIRLLDSGQLDGEGIARIQSSSLPIVDDGGKCVLTDCNGYSEVLVRFYGNNSLLTMSSLFDLQDACSYRGCATLTESCSWETVDPSHPLADSSLQVCVPLESGQSARVYYETTNGMSAFHTFPATSENGEVCEVFDDLQGLTPADICLGVRVFGENHVGSAMQHLGCLELTSEGREPPPRPLLNAPEAVSNVQGDFFDLHWSMPMAGIGSYIMKISNGDEGRYESLWNIQPDDTGLYPYLHPMSQEDMQTEWCFQVRALATDMQVSPWSNEQCDTWFLGEQPNLPWPPVAEPLNNEGETLGAFYMETADDHRPVLVLSDDMTSVLANLTSCVAPIPSCTLATAGVPCLRDTEFEYNDCPACDIVGSVLEQTISSTHFIVYRQESGRDFIQVSPLVESFYCRNGLTDKLFPLSFLQDPFITFLNIDETVVTGVSDPAAIGTGVRVLYKDRYPFKAGTSIRYKLVSINDRTGEPEQIFTSNWVTIP